MEKLKKVIINGKKYEEDKDGFRCRVCGAYMEGYYSEQHGFANPHNWQDYDTNVCHNCGAEWNYIEGYALTLSNEEYKLILEIRKQKTVGVAV